MAKKSIIHRNLKRVKIVDRMRAPRKKLKEMIRKVSIGEGPEDPDEAILKLQKQLQKRRRNESPVRVRERCRHCGRARATIKKFGLCRIHLREAVMRGDVPGLRKASW